MYIYVIVEKNINMIQGLYKHKKKCKGEKKEEQLL